MASRKLDAKAIGQRIAAARKAQKMSGTAVGDVVGATKSAVSQWENGIVYPDFQKFAQLCVLLDVSADFILWGQSDLLSDAERKLVKLWRAENPSQTLQEPRSTYGKGDSK